MFNSLGRLVQRAASAVADTARELAADVNLPARVGVLRHQVITLEAKLYRLERTSDGFTTRTGQRVESREVMLLRKEVVAKKKELAAHELLLRQRTEAARGTRLQIARQIR